MRNHLTGICSCVVLLVLGCRPAPVPAPAESPQKQSLLSKPAPQEVVTADKDFERLTLEKFTAFQGDDGTWTAEADTIICSGVPKGYLYSKEKFKNFTLRGDYQFVLTAEQMEQPDKANTGFMIAIQEPHKVWPVSLEVQGRFDNMGSINGNGGIPALKIDDHPEVRERVRLPAGQWNSIEITFQNGKISSRLNGELVCESEPTDLKEGLLGLQAEGYVVRFRNLRVRRDAATTEQPVPAAK